MQLRGAQLAFKQIFAEEAKPPVISLTPLQGRNQDLNRSRNECLVDRYYFICRQKGTDFRYEAAIKEVAGQFFLSPYHTGKIVLNHHNLLTELKIQWKSEPIEKMARHFTKKWPHLVW